MNKAVGPDCISHRMLKTAAIAVSKPLCIFFNMYLHRNRFSKFWKIAHVLSLFKKDDPSIKSNYRPVSLLSSVGKIMESVVFKHEYNFFFFQYYLFYKYQAGFLPDHSTVFQLLETNHSIVKCIDEGKSCCMIFCDLSNAFDRVQHKGLLFKLQTYGETGNLLEWFRSYLSDKKTKKNNVQKLLSSSKQSMLVYPKSLYSVLFFKFM